MLLFNKLRQKAFLLKTYYCEKLKGVVNFSSFFKKWLTKIRKYVLTRRKRQGKLAIILLKDIKTFNSNSMKIKVKTDELLGDYIAK